MIRFCRKTIIGRLARSIVVIAPGFAEGWNKRATVHYLLGNYHKSLTDIAETLALDSFEATLEIYPSPMAPATTPRPCATASAAGTSERRGPPPAAHGSHARARLWPGGPERVGWTGDEGEVLDRIAKP